VNGNLKHVLVIRLSALGDVAMTVPVLLAFKAANPGVKITVVTRGTYIPIFKAIPEVATFSVDTKGRHRGLWGLFKLARELKSVNPTAIADLHNVLRTKILGIFLIGSGTPFQTIDKGRTAKRRLTRSKNKVWQPLRSTHDRYADVFVRLGFNIALLSGKYMLPAQPWPERFKGNLAGLKIGIAPFAAHQGKCYPEELMQRVIEEFQHKTSLVMYLFGGGTFETDKLSAWASQYSNCRNVAGRLSLAEELAIISNLDLMISMDSGNGHLAAIFGVPVITLWGVTHPFAGFAPYGQPESHALLADRNQFPNIPTSVYGNRTPEGYEKAIAGILPEQVVKLALQILGPAAVENK
jgi:ADP-heptose:LPS heptosyltransferase